MSKTVFSHHAETLLADGREYFEGSFALKRVIADNSLSDNIADRCDEKYVRSPVFVVVDTRESDKRGQSVRDWRNIRIGTILFGKSGCN